MRTPYAACLAAALIATTAGQARADVMRHWSNHALGLGLSYPSSWHVVAERGAALKVVAPDAAGEFEVLSLPAASSQAALAAVSDAALARLHCAVSVRHTSALVGRLGVMGMTAIGACTGGDSGWQLTITAFNHGKGALLTRSWLFHRQVADASVLTGIAGSLAPVK